MKKLSFIVFFDAFLLMLLGLIIVMSASSTYSQSNFHSLFYLFNKHVWKVVIAFGFLILFSAIPYETYREYSKYLIIAGVILLVLTLIFGIEKKGSQRWLGIGGYSFQTADFAKLVLVIHLSAMIEKKGDLIKNFREGYLYLFIWIMTFSVLILFQPNVSNAILIVFLSIVLLYIGGANLKHIAVSSLVVLVLGLAAAMLIPHSRDRILAYLHPGIHSGAQNKQVWEALIGLGSGGIHGRGLGSSMQSNLFLPEAYGDFIFAVLGEELGFIGTVSVVIAYLFFFGAGILIAKKAKDTFGQLLAFGITFTVTTYAFVNMAVATGLIPTTGLTLPFISYGGTSLVFLCMSVGILVNIGHSTAKEIEERKIKAESVAEASEA